MTDALFLGELPEPTVLGSPVELTGPEGHHATAVRRIRLGESVIIADGAGRAVRGAVVEVGKARLVVEVAELLAAPARELRITVAQALAKGDRAELAVEMLTEVGVDAIWPWQSARSIVRWNGERGEKSRARWQSTAREATKQSRRFRIPEIGPVVGTPALARAVADFDATLVLHEDATQALGQAALPASGSVLIVVGPEGGISPEELEALVAAGATPVVVSDGVLRTSTAGVVALAQVLSR